MNLASPIHLVSFYKMLSIHLVSNQKNIQMVNPVGIAIKKYE